MRRYACVSKASWFLSTIHTYIHPRVRAFVLCYEHPGPQGAQCHHRSPDSPVAVLAVLCVAITPPSHMAITPPSPIPAQILMNHAVTRWMCLALRERMPWRSCHKFDVAGLVFSGSRAPGRPCPDAFFHTLLGLCSRPCPAPILYGAAGDVMRDARVHTTSCRRLLRAPSFRMRYAAHTNG
jgi:hypothetical protein